MTPEEIRLELLKLFIAANGHMPGATHDFASLKQAYEFTRNGEVPERKSDPEANPEFRVAPN